MKPHQRTSQDFPDEPYLALTKKCAEIKEQLHQERSSDILFRHDLGRQFDEILNNPDEYGDAPRAIRHLARELQIDQSRIADHVRMYNAFSRKQIEKLLDRSVKTDYQLSFAHLIELSKVQGKDKRQKLIERVFDEALSANQLNDEAFELIGPRRKSGAGRKPKRPTSPMAGFRQMTKANQAINNRFTNGWLEIMLESLEVSPDKFDEQSQQQAMACKEHWVRTHEISKDMIAKFDLLEGRFGRINRHRAEQHGLGDIDDDPIEEASLENTVDDDDFDGKSVESDPEHESDIGDEDPFDFHDDDDFGTEAA